MHRIHRLLAVIAIGLTATIVGCGRQPTSTPKSSAVPQTPTVTKPAVKIWVDTEAQKVAGALGHEATVYRWENGIFDGWLQFDTDGEPQRMPLDFGRKFYNEVMQDEGGQPPAADRFSGMAIISRVKVKDDEPTDGNFDWYEYKIILQTTWTLLAESGTSGSSGTSSLSVTPQGRIKFLKGKPSDPQADTSELKVKFASDDGGQLSTSAMVGTVITLEKYSTEEKNLAVWMELRVVDPTK